MQRLRRLLRQVAMVGGFTAVCASASAADLHVLASTALKPLFDKVAPAYEAASGERLVFAWGASYGNAADALPMRLGRGEAADVVVMIRAALDEQARQGRVQAQSVQDLASSRIGLAVQRAAPTPDISSVEGLRQTLLAAESVAYSSGVSGAYVAASLLPKLGIAEQLKLRSIVVEAPELVGHALLRGEAQVGLQQMSELLAVPGIEIVGPLPDTLQQVNVIAAGVAANARRAEAARALIRFLQSSATARVLEESGFSPVTLP